MAPKPEPPEILEELARVRAGLRRAQAMGITHVRRRARPRREIEAPPPPPAHASGEPAAPSPAPVAPQLPLARGGQGHETLEEIRADLGECQRCKLAQTRTKIAFGDGSPTARVVFVGEGPGRDEDLQGIPFVGRAGQLLTDIIEKGMGMRRPSVYICNVVKCRPTVDLAFQKDRPPEPDEVAACGEFLRRQLRAIGPEVIVTLGNPATKFLLETAQGITRLRGNWQEWEGIAVMPTFHPAYVLRNPPSKREVWEDIQQVMNRLGLEVQGKK